MERTTAVVLGAIAVLIAGSITQLDTTVAVDDVEVGIDELVGGSSSRCLELGGASPGDIAVVNITNTGASGGGWGALRSSDATPVFDRPVADQYASVNFAANTPPNPNLAFTKIGSDNEFCYDGAVSSHDVILDLAAIIPGSNIDAIDPIRLLDTRSTAMLSANSSRCVAVPGAGPGDVAVVNITNTGATGGGWGALRPFDDFPDNPFTGPVFDLPVADQYASVNFAADTAPNPNLAFTMLGSESRFCYDGAVSSHHVILDLAAIIPGSNVDSEAERVLDTRGSTPLSASSSRCVPAPAGAVAGDVVVVNITNTQATGGGWGALRSSDDAPVFDRPVADQYASVNFAANTPPNPNLAFTEVGSDNEFCYDGAVSSHHVILDLAAVIPASNIDAIDPTRLLDTRTGFFGGITLDECRLQTPGPEFFVASFADSPDRLQSVGTVEIAVLFAEFDDVSASRTPEEIMSILSPGAEDFFDDQSYGRFDVRLEPHLQWLRLSGPQSEYADAIRTFEGHRDFIQEAVTLADSAVDFSDIDLVLVMSTPEATEIGFGPTWMGGSFPGGVLTPDGASITNGITSGADLLFWGDLWLPHEMGHSLGLPDFYSYTSPEGFTRPFSVMDLINSDAPGMFAYSRWLLDWIDDDQVECLDESATIDLRPVAVPGGTKLAAVPLGPQRALMVESRRAIGYDSALTDTGVVAYVVDTSVWGGSGPVRVLDGQSALSEGQVLTFEGVTITVLNSDSDGDTVSIEID